MAWVLANDEHLAMASDDLALIAHFLDRRTYLHNFFLSVNVPILYIHTQPLVFICKSHAAFVAFFAAKIRA